MTKVIHRKIEAILDGKPVFGDLMALSITDFCRVYGVGRTFTYEQIKCGALKAKNAGRRRLIGASDARHWWDSLPAESIQANSSQPAINEGEVGYGTSKKRG